MLNSTELACFTRQSKLNPVRPVVVRPQNTVPDACLAYWKGYKCSHPRMLHSHVLQLFPVSQFWYVVATPDPQLRGTGDVTTFVITCRRRLGWRHMARAVANVAPRTVTVDVTVQQAGTR
jgi:hypothetical protein